MDFQKCISLSDAPSTNMAPFNFANKVHAVSQIEGQEGANDHFTAVNVDIDIREVYFLMMHFLANGPCQKTFRQISDELLEHGLLPRRYHAYYSRSGTVSGDKSDDGISFPLNYDDLIKRFPHIEDDHLVKLLRQLMMSTSPSGRCIVGRNAPSAPDASTLLGTGRFSLLSYDRNGINKQKKHVPSYLRWPHMQSDQVRALRLREIGGGFPKHHRAPSIRFACYAVAKPSTMVQKMQNIKKLRGHRAAVYCAIFDRSGRYVITGSDDRLVKFWSMETAFCLASCRGHEGDITDLAVSSNNFCVASASNDYTIRVWRLPDGYPISVLQGHTGAVTAIAFSPRPSSVYQLLSSSDDGTCRIWDARSSDCAPRVYLPKPTEMISGKTSIPAPTNMPSSSNTSHCHQILCCAYNANGTVFVTGSSDTHARVWSACKSSSDVPAQPSHEIDLLAGHENDVNYVQFSGCAVAPRSSTSDFLAEEKIPQFKNSRFSHDNIVTCSRDGSAIIWTLKSRRSQGKVGRWVRAYHLKVPPPPMPPQPPRGGPRQRFLPTPRGVNMIVWSLDNRFVLAAIMDCRICVWNASDGSLVHSLTGHTSSTYVLDVHPFNPRIAMSAGYDGKTIVWDIWEGIPIWTYEIGRFKLVDGKFSQDGTSIVLSDDVGQICFLNTGQGESQKDAKYDQFFLGDYRPLVKDTHGNTLDQETQILPYQRNMQDALCDSSMLPYPEPYQSMYQRHRLGALNIEWRPSSIKLAVGPDIGLSQDYQVLPLADLDLVVDPVPEFVDAMLWEPENDVMHDETDSEYFVTDEDSSEEEQEHSSDNSSDPECSEEDKVGRSHKDGLRRSKRKKTSAEVQLSATFRRHVKRKISHGTEGSSLRSKRMKPRMGQKGSSKSKSAEIKFIRPQRYAARNAVNGFSHALEISADEEEESPEDDSPGTDSSLECTHIQLNQSVHCLSEEKQKIFAGERGSLNKSENALKCPKQIESQANVENKKRLILKLPLRNSKTSLSKDIETEFNHQSASFLRDSGPSSSGVTEFPEPKKTQEDLKTPAGFEKTRVWWGEVKESPASRMQSGYPMPADSCHGSNLNSARLSEIRSANHEEKLMPEASVSEDPDVRGDLLSLNEQGPTGSDSGLPNDQNIGRVVEEHSESHPSGDDMIVSACHAVELNKIQKTRPIILRIKTNKILQGPTTVDVPTSSKVDLSSCPAEQIPVPSLQESDGTEFSAGSSGASIYNCDMHGEFPDIATDAIRRKRSLRLKATTRHTDVSNQKYNVNSVYLPTSSLGVEMQSRKALDRFPSRGLLASTKIITPKSSRDKGAGYYTEDRSAVSGRNSHISLRKSNWLLLTEQEEGYRYIPQLGDEVVYLRQGHQEYTESSQSFQQAPWLRNRNMRAAEACLVDELDYSTIAGSGESGCKITLKFIDPSSEMVGQKFKLTLPDLIGFPDFVVERTWYDASMNRNWSCRDKCLVWWKEESEEGGGWWDGRIVSVKDKSNDFPYSPWERYTIKYKCDLESLHLHSPWELRDPAIKWEHPSIEAEARRKMLTSFTRLLHSAGRNQDLHGTLKLQEISQKGDFINKFPVPLSPEIIKLRLEKNYYRNLDSLKHDVKVMVANGRSYLAKSRDFSSKMSRLSDWFSNRLSEL